MAITQTITGFSGLPPSTSDPTNFDARASTTLAEMYDLPAEVNTWAGQANTLAVTISGLEASASLSAVTAEEAADAVLSQGVTANAWSSVTTYALYQVAIGTDGRAYRSLQASNLNHNPVTDVGTWWRPLNPDLWLAAMLIVTTGLYPGWSFQSQDPVGTYPPSTPDKPAAYVWSRGVERYRASLTWGTTGGEADALKTARMEYSNTSGSSYVSVSSTPLVTLTYSTSGAVIAAAWSA